MFLFLSASLLCDYRAAGIAEAVRRSIEVCRGLRRTGRNDERDLVKDRAVDSGIGAGPASSGSGSRIRTREPRVMSGFEVLPHNLICGVVILPKTGWGQICASCRAVLLDAF
jgi:hypothetical protein